MIILDILERGEAHQRQVLQALTGEIPEEKAWDALDPAARGSDLRLALRRWFDAPADHLQEVLRERLVELAGALLDLTPDIWVGDPQHASYDLVTDEQLSWGIYGRLRGDAEATLNDDLNPGEAVRVASTIGRRVVLTPEPERSRGITRFWTLTGDRPLTLEEAERELAEGRAERFGLDQAPDNAFELYGYVVLDAIADSERLLGTPEAPGASPDWPIAAPYLAELLVSLLLRDAPVRPTIEPLQASSPPTRTRRAKELRGLAALALAARAGRPDSPTSMFESPTKGSVIDTQEMAALLDLYPDPEPPPKRVRKQSGDGAVWQSGDGAVRNPCARQPSQKSPRPEE